MSSILNFIVNFVNEMGYIGIFFAMVLNGSILPVPSEVFITPAGYLASKGSFNFFLVIILGSLGSLCGSLINYFLGYKIGRPFLIKYGKYFRISEKSIEKGELWFKKYGIYAIFLTRFIPTIRQYITVIPGILKMNLTIFSLFCFIGDVFVVSFLTLLGYFFGEYSDVIKPYLDEIYIVFFSLLALSIVIYIFYIIFKRRREKQKITSK